MIYYFISFDQRAANLRRYDLAVPYRRYVKTVVLPDYLALEVGVI